MYFNKSSFFQILYLSPIIIMKQHESGFQKRKKKQQLHQIPKLDKFIIHTYKILVPKLNQVNSKKVNAVVSRI